MTLITAALVFLAVVRSNAFEFWDPAEEYPDLNTYFDNDFIASSFSDLQKDYPNLVKISSLGKTPGENEMHEITITSNVSSWQTANKPSVKYVANMHGNEIRGRGLLMKLAYFLSTRYDSDQDVRDILDATVFHLIPTINPDGFDQAYPSCSGVTGRYTSDGTDMNRDFPSHWFSGIRVKTAEETQMIKDYAKKVPAVMGISFHDGALVTNYPWDGEPDIASGVYAASPDDSLFISMAKTYSLNHKQMYKPSAQCGNDNFKNGITNGNKWYKVYNGMQDWNYFYNDCFEVTIELGCCKYPTDAALTYTNVWSDNFDSILAFSKLANYGIKGRVTDFKGSPMTGVTITVSGVSKTVKVRHPEGYFWRPLLKGTYNISASKPGYYPLSRRNIEVIENQSTVVPFILIAKKSKENNTNEQNSSVEDKNTEREDEDENVEDNESIDQIRNMDRNKDVDENDNVDDSENVDYNDIGDGSGNDSVWLEEGPEGEASGWEPDFAVDPADFPPDIEETDGTEYENQMSVWTELPVRSKFTRPHSFSLPLTTTSSPFSPSYLYSSPFTTLIIDAVLRNDEGSPEDEDRIDNETGSRDENGGEDSSEADEALNYSSDSNSSAIVLALLLSAAFVLC